VDSIRPECDPETAGPGQSRVARIWKAARNLLTARRLRKIGLFVGIAAGTVTVIRGGPALWEFAQTRTEPHIGLAFYDEDGNGHKRILQDNKISVDLTPGNMVSSVIHIPIRLALKNAGAEDLNNVRVKIRYDPSVKIRSEALQKILGGSAVYEQEIGRIDRRDEYVFLPKTDELSLKVFTAPEEIIAVTADQVPMYMIMLVIIPETENPHVPLALHRAIPIEVSVLANRAPLTKPISLSINFDLQYLWPPNDLHPIVVREISDKDRKLIQDMRTAIKTVSPVWTAPYDTSREIAYYKLHSQSESSHLQLAAINNDLRYIGVSTGEDGKLDYQLMIPPEPEQPNKQIWGKSLPMIDWKKSAIATQGNTEIDEKGLLKQQ
jgi:hypothetical protein